MVRLTELSPEPSSSFRYDVFLSFRGADTRNSITDHLYNALLDAGVITFLDDEEIETGEPLKPELEAAIKSSRASIIVLSENYASSTWCLDELLLILEQKKDFNQIVIPIFYHVEPTDVRKQQNSFREAMSEHKKRMKTERNAGKKRQLAQKMKLWKRALTQVADLKGKDAKDRKEREFIKEVVTDIHRRLGLPLSITLPRLIGMYHYIRSIGSWLTDGSCHAADIITIGGMSGIGKTSLARYVFGLHSSKFDKSSFIEGINTRCTAQFSGLLDLQKQLCAEISKNIPLQAHDVSVYMSKINNALAHKKVLLVLDDVGCLHQLDVLLGNKAFHKGSKIIITTRDASLTERCALFNPQVQPKHMKVSLNGLDESESLELLCGHAFKSWKPKEGFEDVSEKLVKYCDGHPLALQVLGRSLQNQDVAYWEDCIKVLKKEPHARINAALKMSFDALPFENDKELFKHIACFFVGIDRDVTDTILNACDIKTKRGIAILIDKCLLTIGCDNELMMHQLIQEMGRDLVRQESPEKPWKRSRLWYHEESFKVLKQEKGKGNLLGLALDMRMLDQNKLHGSFELETKSLSKMDNLMLLQLNYVQLNGCFENFPEELRWLCMHGSPLKSIPLDLPMDNLVALDMSYSNIESFEMSYSNQQAPMERKKRLVGSCSKDKRLLGSLKILDLSFCEQLHIVGGFSELPALERLIVQKCSSLIEVCESVEQCDELVHIDLSYCYKLRKLPITIGKLKKVKTLLLDGCNFHESQIETGNMNSSTVMKVIPSDWKFFVISLPSSLRRLSLASNNLCIESFPVDFSFLAMLEELCLDNNPIVSIPDCVRTLPRLKKLSMYLCEMLKSIENPPCTLRELAVYPYRSFEPEYNTSLRKIKFDPEMSPLKLRGALEVFGGSSSEIDGMVKIQGMASVEEKVLHSLGWTDIDFIKERHFKIKDFWRGDSTKCETQMYYEFGIFSTIYEGLEMPDLISRRSEGPSISFTIPSSPKKLRGLNFCCAGITANVIIVVPMIKVSNITKNLTWIYDHYVDSVKLGGKRISLLSHWMFGPNEMKAGDQITITVAHKLNERANITVECGISVVYDDDGRIEEEEEEDVLGYYKSWNHIIGGDLSPFQLTTGEHILDNNQFRRVSLETCSNYYPFIDYGASFKEAEVSFRAFSQKKKSEKVGEEVHMGSFPYDVGDAIDAGGISTLANASPTEQRTASPCNLLKYIQSIFLSLLMGKFMKKRKEH